MKDLPVRVRQFISLCRQTRFCWYLKPCDVLLVDELTFGLRSFVDPKFRIRFQKFRNAEYWVSPYLVVNAIRLLFFSNSLKGGGMQAKYLYVLCATTRCRLVITCADYNSWDILLVEGALPLRMLCIQSTLRIGNNHNKKYDVYLTWGKYLQKNIRVVSNHSIGSYMLGMFMDTNPQLYNAELKHDLLFVSIIRLQHLTEKTPICLAILSATNTVLKWLSDYRRSTKVAFAFNAKRLADWYSKEEQRAHYKPIISYERKLVRQYFPEGLNGRYFRSPHLGQERTYVGICESRLIIGFMSATLFEAIGLGKKVLFCHHLIGESATSQKELFESSVPEVMIIRSGNYTEFTCKVRNLLAMSDEEYRELTAEFRRNFIRQTPNFGFRLSSIFNSYLPS